MIQPALWCSDPAAAAGEIKKLWPQRAEAVIRTADDIVKGIFTFQDHWEMECCPEPVTFGPRAADIRWDLIPYGDQEWLFAFNRHTIFLNLSKAWLFTGNDRYLSRLSELWEDWIDRNPLTKENEGSIWRSLEAGLRCEFWLRTLCLTAGSRALSPALQEKISRCLRTHGEYLVRKHQDFQKFSNWGVLQDHGLFLLGVWFDHQEWIHLAAERLDRQLHRQIMADGCHWEHSPMYHCEVLHCAIDTVVIARQNHIDLPERFLRNVQKMCHAVLGMVSPDGVLLCQGDSDAIDARNELALGALLFGDAQLRCAAGDIPLPENLWDLGLDAWALRDLPDQAPDLNFAQPDSGNYLLRSDGTREAAYLHFYCGPIGGGHGHADQLHIDAGIGHQPVLMDSGRYTYMDTPLRMELKSPRSHNTTTVDNTDFTVGTDTWAWKTIAVPFKGQARFTENISYLSGHHMGYLSRCVVPTREILWLRQWKTAVIFDWFLSESPDRHIYQQYFHFGPGKVSLEENRVHWQGEDASADLHCLGQVSCQLGTAPCSRKYNVLSSCDVLTVTQEAVGFAAFVTVLDLEAASPLTIRQLPVSCIAGEITGDPRMQALELVRGEEKAVIMLRSDEAVPPRVMLKAGQYEGCGRALVFDRKNPDGLCLAW